MATMPKRYRITNLLTNGAQPFRNVDPATRDSIKLNIQENGDTLKNCPVTLSRDGILFDGHQRLLILAELGRKVINPGEYRLDPTVVGHDQAYLAAINVGFNRRQLTGKDKADIMWSLRRDYAMSQTEIAKRLHMTQPGVSQLMNTYEPDDIDDMPDETLGADGRRTRPHRGRQRTDRRGGPDVTAKDDYPTPYEFRQRVKKHLKNLSTAANQLGTDAPGADFATFEERDGVITQITGIIESLSIIRDRFTARGQR